MTASSDGLLGSFEELVLLALARSGERAYGMVVRRELAETTGRDPSIGAVYSTLDRMEQKGWLSSYERAEEDRRSRGRRYFRLTPSGIAQLERARSMRRKLSEGVELEGLEAGEV
ncbi:MAG TPA: PadR family transcriptional regulator [Longimicrobiales bacterium]|nr:PadR family transcriptional regulator [Longimicrobiales bacterium]